MTEATRYPAYRDSGLPWAPRVPEGWQTLRNGRLFTHRVQTGFPDLPILEVSLRTGVRVRDMENLKRKQVMREKEKYKRAAKGDIAYNMMRMWQGALGTAPVDGLVSPAYVVASPFPEANSEYYSYLFRTAAYMREVNKFSRGIVADRNRLYWDEFKQMPALLPSRPEQDQIVAYLRAHDAHIARFVKTKRELIGVLNEQRQLLICDYLTRGFERFAPLKDSGTPWLGAVPSDWNVCRLKGQLVLNEGGCWGNDPIGSSGTPVIRSTEQAVDGTWRIQQPALRQLSETERKAKTLKEGDLVITKSSGSEQHIGKTSLVDRQIESLSCCFSNFMQRLRPKPTVTSAWIWYFLNCRLGRDQMAFGSNSTTGLGNLSRQIIGDIWFALPPRDDQERIIERVEALLAPLDTAIDQQRNHIALIREYRDRQIADVVTGQVDVRSWVPSADDEVDDDALTTLDNDEPNTDGELVDGDD